MKLGLSYNLWDGEELLISSLQNIRDVVDYISIVYQNISNHGEEKENLTPLMKLLKHNHTIDEYYFFSPDSSLDAHTNETSFRTDN